MAPSVDPRFDGVRIPDPGFSGDEGDADDVVFAALADHASGGAAYASTLAAILGSRVLVPVVAVVDEVEYDAAGLAHDKSSDMATVILTGRDGRRALLGFTSMASLHAWQSDARPVPVTLQAAALAAKQEEADALVLDLAGPAMFVIEGADLTAVAEGAQLVHLDGRWGWLAPDPGCGAD